MTKLKYGNILLDVYDGYELNKSSQEVAFSDLVCDFTNHTIVDLPEKYQEAKLVEIDEFNSETIIFFGYIENYNFGEMREKDIDTDINITLLSPMKLTTLRTITAVGTYKLTVLIEEILLKPLIEDGFTIEEINITDRQTTVNFLVETIEYCMNNLSNKFNFWWFIDEKKKIYIKDISQILKKDVDYIYDKQHSINGLQYVKPTISSENYANVVNFKNVRIYEYSRLSFNGTTTTESHNPLIENQITTIKKDGQLDFRFPIDTKKENIIKSAKSNGISGIMYGLHIKGLYTDNTTFELYIKYDEYENKLEISNNIGYDGGTDKEKEFLLIKDSFFSNLITGLKYNNENKNIKSITLINSDSALIWNVNKFYNDKAISEKRGKISNTGIVEYTIDMNESWKTIQELRDIGITYMENNSINTSGEVEMLLDKKIFKIGDTIKINKMLIDGTYIVTEIRETEMNNDPSYIVICKNANLLNNFIDIFRGENSQTNADKLFKMYITHYQEEEINEIHKVVQ